MLNSNNHLQASRKLAAHEKFGKMSPNNKKVLEANVQKPLNYITKIYALIHAFKKPHLHLQIKNF